MVISALGVGVFQRKDKTMDASIINPRHAAENVAWVKRLHEEYNELTRAWGWVREVTPVTEEEMDRLHELVTEATAQ